MKVKKKSERAIASEQIWRKEVLSKFSFLFSRQFVSCQMMSDTIIIGMMYQQKEKGFPVVLCYQTGKLKEPKKHFVSCYLSF